MPSKKVQGLLWGTGLEKLIKRKNKLVIDIPTTKGKPICEVQSTKLSSEIGVITQQFISIPTKWKAMKDTDKLHAFERLNVSAKYYYKVYYWLFLNYVLWIYQLIHFLF